MPAAKVYLASSWRNKLQEGVVHVLRAAGFDVYDFKNPPNGDGFRWTDAALNLCEHGERTVGPHPCPQCPTRIEDLEPVDKYLEALEHPRAIDGFNSDFDALQAADVVILILPCGRSAHLELGWAIGRKRTAVLLEDPCTPELMYKMVDHLAPNVMDLLGWLGVNDSWDRCGRCGKVRELNPDSGECQDCLRGA